MVCIAAFIILAIIGVVVAFLSIFNRDLGRRYLKVFKKSWHCVFQKVRLQKCDTNFKDDVKNALLKKVVIKHPKWVKPLSAFIEVFSVIIVFITVWSLVVGIKSLLALWVFGTCNVTQPASCSLGAEVCSIDKQEAEGVLGKTGQWFSEWGEIFSAIPDRLHSWPAEDYTVGVFQDTSAASVSGQAGKNSDNLALDIVDPGCVICMQSYKNQLNSNFMDTHNVIVMPYPIKLPDGTEKFANSELLARYMIAVARYSQDTKKSYYSTFVRRHFTEFNKDDVNYQTYVQSLDSETAEKLLQSWLVDFGIPDADIAKVVKYAHDKTTDTILSQIRDIVDNTIHAKGIPTLIYDHKKHSGLFKE